MVNIHEHYWFVIEILVKFTKQFIEISFEENCLRFQQLVVW